MISISWPVDDCSSSSSRHANDTQTADSVFRQSGISARNCWRILLTVPPETAPRKATSRCGKPERMRKRTSSRLAVPMPDDSVGASVTLSVLSNTRVQSGTPILNAPQVCLLFCGAPVSKPVVKDGSVVPGETIHLVSVYDHRVIDGMTGAKFMDALCTYLSA